MIVATSIGNLQVTRQRHHPATNRHGTGAHWTSLYKLVADNGDPIIDDFIIARSTTEAVGIFRDVYHTPRIRLDA